MAWWTAASNDHPFGTMLKVTNVAPCPSLAPECPVFDQLAADAIQRYDPVLREP
jgi:hypothetical protein